MKTTWCWTDNIESETWQGNWNGREAAIAAARDAAICEPQPEGFWVAPTLPATQADVDNWMGDDDIELGDPIIDVSAIAHFPPGA